jgi:uncharacterized membrane protein YcaP (DUF421 family)
MPFDSWETLWPVLTVGVVGYAGLVALSRISGNRILSKLNSFDLVITIAFGSILRSILLDSKINLLQGLWAIALLVFLPFAVTWISGYSRFVSHMMRACPMLLEKDGRMLHANMKHARIIEEGEVRDALLQQGLGMPVRAAAVMLETDGGLSVISTGHGSTLDALQGVRGADNA